MVAVMRGLWLVAALGALAGGYIVVSMFLTAESAEHQAQCAAVALALTFIPYCLARAVSELLRKA
jgi:hypothetical protein